MAGHSRVRGEVQGGDEQGGNGDDPASYTCCRCYKLVSKLEAKGFVVLAGDGRGE